MALLSTRDAEGIASALEARERFTTHGALSGAPVTDGLASRLGRLPDEHRSLWRQGVILAESERHTMFAVQSYSTPIAWRVDDGAWIVPDESYSVTTSRHQSRVSHAIHLTGAEVPA